MRLINTKSLMIEEFGRSETPKYAILSHTWGDDEATFSEWCSRLTRLRKSRRPGFSKVLATCKQARRDGLSHVWVDTVCIDKTSSAELSEAINSMFAWYEHAEICYVYLADVPSQPPDGETDLLGLMRVSRWFSRGWTLQELIAPKHVLFYSQSWAKLGTKREFAAFISDVTGISQLCIRKESLLSQYSIAQRMSWAANRYTTRPEDMAYCLLGIFGVNIPLLYGEGDRAFIRLQEEILRTLNDHSVLAFDWIMSQNPLLAYHPIVFGQMKNLRRFTWIPGFTPPFSMTNAGLSIETPLIRTLSPYRVLAVLNCVEVDTESGGLNRICLPLFGEDGIYVRTAAPVCLIRMNLSEVYIDGLREGFEDLTTAVRTKYLISRFDTVYPASGHEEYALVRLGKDSIDNSGFMLTFPRGMGNYQLVEAYPPDALQRNMSFFNPTAAESEQPFAHGLLVFQDMSEPAECARIGVYLAHTLDHSGEDWGGQWMCVLTSVREDAGADLYDRCRRSWQFEEDPTNWKHCDNKGNVIAVARNKFTLRNLPRHTVIVEIVFDADDLLERNLRQPWSPLEYDGL
ncbi:Vegetative incompatibility protein HET-E-1 [Cytospora mali]|uniref:Vegetative incompatibility protein HET-E-1 n=1 Tax=Cytospora mali TaxID=578113 RepID=A0A194UPZ1_CYTMA|nr:Vegetative incompatibility protein HET-E-1 [Valsa mali var. pyri (nom. inval.)]